MAMAGLVRKTIACIHIGRRSIKGGSNLLKFNTNYGNFSRTLFSAQIIGLEGYKRDREQYVNRIGNLKETFRSRMDEYMSKSEANTIFTDDLKTMVHIAESDEDIQTTVNMIKRYQLQRNEAVSFTDFKFGPVVMRLFHWLKNPDKAYELYTDSSISGFFQQLSSAKTLMDLLFETENYSKVFEVFEATVQKNVEGNKYANDCITIYMATCSKMNTPESYRKAKDLLASIQKNSKAKLSVRTVVYLTSLALNQGDAPQALEFLCLTTLQRVVALSNLKMLVLTELGRTDEALNMLRNLTVQDQPEHVAATRNYVFQEVLDKIEATIQKSKSNEQIKQMENMKKVLEEGGNINDLSFNEYLYSPIVRRRQLQDGARRPKNTSEMNLQRGQFSG